MGSTCTRHASVYTVKKRTLHYPDRKEIYVETEHRKSQAVVEIEGSMSLPNQVLDCGLTDL